MISFVLITVPLINVNTARIPIPMFFQSLHLPKPRPPSQNVSVSISAGNARPRNVSPIAPINEITGANFGIMMDTVTVKYNIK